MPASGYGTSGVSTPDNIPVTDNTIEFGAQNSNLLFLGDVQTSGTVTVRLGNVASSTPGTFVFQFTSPAFTESIGYSELNNTFPEGTALTVTFDNGTGIVSITIPVVSGQAGSVDYEITIQLTQVRFETIGGPLEESEVAVLWQLS